MPQIYQYAHFVISFLGFVISVTRATVIASLRLLGLINMPGYTALAVLILSCCMFNNLIAGVVGLYTGEHLKIPRIDRSH